MIFSFAVDICETGTRRPLCYDRPGVSQMQPGLKCPWTWMSMVASFVFVSAAVVAAPSSAETIVCIA